MGCYLKMAIAQIDGFVNMYFTSWVVKIIYLCSYRNVLLMHDDLQS